MLLDCARIVQTTVVYQERNNNLKWKNPLTYLRRIGTSLLYNAGLIEGERKREKEKGFTGGLSPEPYHLGLYCLLINNWH